MVRPTDDVRGIGYYLTFAPVAIAGFAAFALGFPAISAVEFDFLVFEDLRLDDAMGSSRNAWRFGFATLAALVCPYLLRRIDRRTGAPLAVTIPVAVLAGVVATVALGLALFAVGMTVFFVLGIVVMLFSSVAGR